MVSTTASTTPCSNPNALNCLLRGSQTENAVCIECGVAAVSQLPSGPATSLVPPPPPSPSAHIPPPLAQREKRGFIVVTQPRWNVDDIKKGLDEAVRESRDGSSHPAARSLYATLGVVLGGSSALLTLDVGDNSGQLSGFAIGLFFLSLFWMVANWLPSAFANVSAPAAAVLVPFALFTSLIEMMEDDMAVFPLALSGVVALFLWLTPGFIGRASLAISALVSTSLAVVSLASPSEFSDLILDGVLSDLDLRAFILSLTEIAIEAKTVVVLVALGWGAAGDVLSRRSMPALADCLYGVGIVTFGLGAFGVAASRTESGLVHTVILFLAAIVFVVLGLRSKRRSVRNVGAVVAGVASLLLIEGLTGDDSVMMIAFIGVVTACLGAWFVWRRFETQ